ncbi:MAG: cbb3-type cytochrome c oxidase subunit I [Saprospiraceae bacterium]|nr:cbb3-type cytochrome c oxidase subunit I [Saprospiraceae bacterium]HQU95112.1 cbb3-type cytochrome c oxidase subunit I [Saprospiraceae bacterium]HQW94521.1 cbb3-type cytochrome c oxidase subunit I [Saprospiraceae bacterium]
MSTQSIEVRDHIDDLIDKNGFDDHFHDHHESDKYKSSFIGKYIFSLDHKMISRQFLITGVIWAMVGALFSVIFRLQLGFPEADMAWLKPLLGKWIVLNDAGFGTISQEFYYALVTMHGTILVFFVLTAGLSGTFSNFLIPLQVGARDMASPLLNMLSYWFFFLAGIVMLCSLFLNTGPFAGGWTAYPPLSALPQASSGSKGGMNLWIISMTLFIVSQLLGGINYVTTILNLRTKGMSMWKMPLSIWSFFVTAILGILTFPVLFAGVLLLLFDRSMGTSFYLSEIFIQGAALENVGGSPILYQHLFWFLGHPEVYIVILPAMGIVSEVMSVNSRKPIFGYRAMVYSLMAIAFLSLLVWAHHMFTSGMNPFITNFFVLFTLIIAMPSSIKTFNWITTLFRGNLRLNSAMLYSIGFVSLFISGGLTGIWVASSTLDIALHDTYFVVAHFHLVMGVAAFFGMFAGLSYWYPKMFGRYMNETILKVHFWITLIGAYCIFWPQHYLGLAGVPRRYYRFDSFSSFSGWEGVNEFITISAIIVFFTQLLWVFNFFYSMWKGKKVTERNPWHSNSIEWTTPIIPPHGNWPGKLPQVERWPYDYGKDGKDFITQITPYEEGEEVVN